MKLCIDCKDVGLDYSIKKCLSPKLGINPVNGKIDWDYCNSQRWQGWIITRLENKCGKEGRWFEPKDINLNKSA